MTKEQEEAIENLKGMLEYKRQVYNMDTMRNEIVPALYDIDRKAIETVLSMLKEKDKEIEKKDKIIDLILDKVNLNYVEIFYNNEVKEIIEIYEKTKNTNNLSGLELRKSCIKQYFEQEATKMSQERNEEWKKI